VVRITTLSVEDGCMQPGQSLTLTLLFAPTVVGTASGAVTFASDASDANLMVALSGSGTSAGQLAVSPGSMSFSTTVVGTKQSQTGRSVQPVRA
jgi:hypothetical protein